MTSRLSASWAWIGRIRLEEWLYIGFFLVLCLISLMEGEFLIVLYKDRFTWAFILLIGALLTWKLHRALWRMDRLAWSPLADEMRSSFWVLRDLFNLFMCVTMYSSLARILNLFPLKDDWLIKADLWLFGTHPALLLEPLIHPWLTRASVIAYLSLFAYLPILTWDFLRRDQRRAMREFMAALGLAMFFGYLGYVAVPAIGPAYTLAEQFKTKLWANQYMNLTQGALQAAIDANRIDRDCFPSMHTCLAVLALIFAWRHARGWFWVFLPFVLGLIFSTVYLRYHYVVDLFAGLALAWATAVAGPRLLDWWSRRTGIPVEEM